MRIVNVVHIGNQCGVASTLQRCMRNEYSIRVIEKTENDPYGHTNKNSLISGKIAFSASCGWAAHHADLVHIHSHDRFLNFLFLGKIPAVMHYHGTDIRGRWEEKRRNWENADRILVSTRDLLDGAPDGVEYFPNPVDPMFKPGKLPDRECAVHFSYNADEEAQAIAEENDLPLVIVKQKIPHHDIPALLHNYTHIVEVKKKNGKIIMGSVEDTGSLLSLEALASGLTVLCRDGWRRDLPLEHRLEEAVKTLGRIYKELIE